MARIFFCESNIPSFLLTNWKKWKQKCNIKVDHCFVTFARCSCLICAMLLFDMYLRLVPMSSKIAFEVVCKKKVNEIKGKSKRSFHCKSLGLGYYPTLSQMFRFSGFLIFKQKNRWKIIFNRSYGKLFPRSFPFFSWQTFLVIVFSKMHRRAMFT